jgi:transglutaminase-like putative cysteine protease
MTPTLSARSWQVPAAAVFATMATSIGLSRLIHPGTWVAVLLLVSLLLGASGIVMRRIGVARLLILLIQAVLVLFLLTALFAHGEAIAGFVPGPRAVSTLGDKISQGGSDLRSLAPPTPETPGITALLSICGAGFAFVIDALAVTVRRPILAGAPILAVYLIPATREPGGLNWLAFVCAAAGYLVLVGTDGHERLGQWGRAVQKRSGRPTLSGATNTGLTRQIAAWSIGVALLLPLLIPATPQLLKFGGGGAGGGNGDGTIYLNQSVDIAQDLSSPRPTPLFTYTTDSPTPLREYFQQEVLTQFNGTEWDPPSTAVPVGPGAASVPGLSDPGIASNTVHVSVNVDGDFGFSAAPTPYATTQVSGLPDVQIDSHTLTVFVNDGDNHSRLGTHYSTVSTELTPTAAQLADATAGQSEEAKDYLSLPTDVQGLLTKDADAIVAGDLTPYQQAVALQDYFQKNFTYTLTPKISGTGVTAIKSFLDTKSGFCQQFAATMAAMARALGIPAVVAVGYTPGKQMPDGSFQVTTHDAHAWPMLYFDGIGWVQFEPTPSIVSTGRAQPQPWTTAQTQATPTVSQSACVTPTAQPSATATASQCTGSDGGAAPHEGPGGLAVPNACASGGASANSAPPRAFSALGPLGVVPRTFQRWFLTGNAAQIAVKLALLALLLLACLPAAFRLRRWRRRRRVLRNAARRPRSRLPDQRSTADTDDDAGQDDASRRLRASSAVRRELAFTAWEELREYASDLGYGWAESDTPRQLAGRLAVQAEFDAESSEAVGRVTTLVERAVYSPEPHIAPEEAGALPGDVNRVRTALASAAGRAARLRAAVLPNSSIDQLFRRRGRHQ